MSLRKARVPTPSRIARHPRNTQEFSSPDMPRRKAVRGAEAQPFREPGIGILILYVRSRNVVENT
jgi:hypothetical protein